MTNTIATSEEMATTNAKATSSHAYPNGRWQALGGTGDSPVPVGDSPTGMVRRHRQASPSFRSEDVAPMSPGESPGDAGQWPVLPEPTADLTTPEDHFADARRIVDAAIAILAQGEDLLGALSPESYTRRVPLAFNACIGGHYRHCLDHFTSLLRGFDADEVDYDHRERDARIESQPAFAFALTQHMRAQLEQLPVGALDAPVRARCEVSYAHGDSPVTGSTFGRELVYAIAHAIHHYALISVMARLMDVKLPEHFGVAPSTVAHQAKHTAR